MIYGGIDGYFWLIVYFRCSSNNRVFIVLLLFREVINVWGLFLCVRVDDGGENVVVGDVMIYYRGESCGSFIIGLSVYNIRIERLWCEVVYCILYMFKNIFLYLEYIGVFNCNNDVDIFLLYYVYMLRINSVLVYFVDMFNNYGFFIEYGLFLY